MAIRPVHTALAEAQRWDYAEAPRPGEGALAAAVASAIVAAVVAAPEPLAVCVVASGSLGIPAGRYSLDLSGFLHRIAAPPPALDHLDAGADADVAVLLGGPATTSASGYRRLSVAAGVASHHLTARLATVFRHVGCDDETIAWPLATVTAPMTHLTTVTGKEPR